MRVADDSNQSNNPRVLLRDTHQHKHTHPGQICSIFSVKFFQSQLVVILWKKERGEEAVKVADVISYKGGEMNEINWTERLRAGVGLQSLSRTMDACRQTHVEAASTWASRHAFGSEKHWIQGAWRQSGLDPASKYLVWCEQTLCWGLNQCRPTDTLTLEAKSVAPELETINSRAHLLRRVPSKCSKMFQNIPDFTELVSKIATWLRCLFCFKKMFSKLQQVNEQIFLECHLDGLEYYSDSHHSGF